MITDALGPGDRLPSVRELAVQLAINPNTIQRAYRELENESYIYSIPGKGSFVKKRDDIKAERRNMLMGEFDALVAELLYLCTSKSELIDRIESISEKTVTGGDDK